MSEDHYEEIIKRLEKIERALIGEGMEGEKGVMHWVQQMVEDIYGTQANRRDSLMTRMSVREDEAKKVKWMAAGWASCAGFVGIVAGFLGDKIFHK